MKYVESFQWLGCSIAATGAATSRIRLRYLKAIAAWRVLCKDFDFNKLAFPVKAKLYQLVIEPTLTHGCVPFGMSKDDWQTLEKTQNIIQRSFIKSRLTDVHERWIEIHSKLKVMRERGDVSDVCVSLRKAYSKAVFTKETTAIIQYRNDEWQAANFQGKPRRRQVRPPITLAKTLHTALLNS